MNQQRWEHALFEARQDTQLCRALAEFLASNGVVLEKETTADEPIYSVRFARPHIEEVDRSGRKHWAVKA